MKRTSLFTMLAAVAVVTLSLSSCRLIGDIFKAGVWAGVLLVVGVVGLIIFIISRIAGGGK